MTTASIVYSNSASITMTVTSLADNTWRSSASVDNSTNNYIDALVSGSVQIGNPTSSGALGLYAYGSIDGGTVYSGGLDGTDTTVTWGTTPSTSSVWGYYQCPVVGSIQTASTDDGNDIEFGPYSIARAFGGALPDSWGLLLRNDTGATTNATGTNNTFDYVGVKYQAV